MFGGKFDLWQVYRVCRVFVVCFYIFVKTVKGPSAGFQVRFYKITNAPFWLKLLQKQPSRGALRKLCSENMQQIYRRTPMLKCDFNKTTLLKSHFSMFVLL